MLSIPQAEREDQREKKKSWLIERRVTGWQELRRSTFIRRSICDGAETTEVAEEINVLEIKMGFFFFISTSHLQKKKTSLKWFCCWLSKAKTNTFSAGVDLPALVGHSGVEERTRTAAAGAFHSNSQQHPVRSLPVHPGYHWHSFSC